MSEIENRFDINQVLKKSFFAVKEVADTHKIEFIFEMHPTVPRELKGDVNALEKLLETLLCFVSEHTVQNEILLSINAPEDFLYEEEISFVITNTDIDKEKIHAFLEKELNPFLTHLEGTIVYDHNDIHLDIPFTLAELGFRRHYRLPSKSMLQKKVLIIVRSENVTKSITKMFKYFPYDVDLGLHDFQNSSLNLALYDVVVIEEGLLTDTLKSNIQETKQATKTKFVLLGDEGLEECNAFSAYLVKPVTQESIFELIVSLFDENSTGKENISSVVNEDDSVSSDKAEDEGTFEKLVESKKEAVLEVLDISKGLENAETQGMLYSDELKAFLEIFEQSDLYFRQIVNEKAERKIQEFCSDLEKYSKSIGAERMIKFVDTVRLIFVYNKLDMLPIYPGRYHLELEKLIGEIKKYLHIK